MGEDRASRARRTKRVALCSAIVFASAVAAGAVGSSAVPGEGRADAAVACEPQPFLDNGVIRVGVDTAAGGAISLLGPSGSEDNLVNTWDLGRYVQQSYFTGPFPYLPAGEHSAPRVAGLAVEPDPGRRRVRERRRDDCARQRR